MEEGCESLLEPIGNQTEEMSFGVKWILATAQPLVLMLSRADSCHRLFPDTVFI